MPEPCRIKELNGKTYRCYFELTLSVIGGKWKPIILNHLALEQVMRFGELTRSIPEITQRMLTKQLRELEADGLVHREVYREVPPRVEYSLTRLGYTIIPILQHMRQWGVDYEKHLGGEGLFEDEGFECAEPPELLAL
ncbi:winged helix-turn-helix transcriptional regulator [Desulfoluna spongiiphila]|uniref:winged helix-turn-helix transcriptional regulator n=1 Tax=Desulfoluna spongiiphila TaxID=419481 RepID=UPI00125364FC|nr:helix-turn-helix domain-containing protein [Desulfoluna spongiiphila]VVS95004.1 helix-turn-helix hxlr type [Desulfoluna spongiiphila]